MANTNDIWMSQSDWRGLSDTDRAGYSNWKQDDDLLTQRNAFNQQFGITQGNRNLQILLNAWLTLNDDNTLSDELKYQQLLRTKMMSGRNFQSYLSGSNYGDFANIGRLLSEDSYGRVLPLTQAQPTLTSSNALPTMRSALSTLTQSTNATLATPNIPGLNFNMPMFVNDTTTPMNAAQSRNINGSNGVQTTTGAVYEPVRMNRNGGKIMNYFSYSK